MISVKIKSIFNLVASSVFRHSRSLGVALVLILLVLAWVSVDLNKKMSKFKHSKVFYDRNHNFLRSYLSPDETYRFSVDMEKLPEWQVEGLLCLEDKYFYSHFGVNPIAILSSMKRNLISKQVVSGASTIDMQLVKQLIPYRRSYFNKIKQAVYASMLNVFWSKETILNRYLESISCLLYTSPSPRDQRGSRMPSSA